MSVRRGLAVLMMVAVLAVAGCGASGGDRPPGPAGSSGGTDSYTFSVATLDGGTFDGRSMAGKPAVLWFWAPWCPTCLGQAKQVNALVADYAGKATVVGVAGLDKVAEMRDFVGLAKLSGFPQLADEQGVVWQRFGMTQQSTFVVLDAQGAVAASGRLDPAGLPARLDKLLVG
jgi:peroxiredoxin